MRKQIIIQVTKCTLVLDEGDIWKLPPEILQKALQRGKAYRRTEAVERRKKGGKEHE